MPLHCLNFEFVNQIRNPKQFKAKMQITWFLLKCKNQKHSWSSDSSLQLVVFIPIKLTLILRLTFVTSYGQKNNVTMKIYQLVPPVMWWSYSRFTLLLILLYCFIDLFFYFLWFCFFLLLFYFYFYLWTIINIMIDILLLVLKMSKDIIQYLIY